MATTYEVVTARLTVPPAVRANGTVNGSAVSLLATGSDAAMVLLLTGTITDGSHAVTIEESDTGTGGWSAIPVGRLTAAAPTIAAANDDTQFEVGFITAKAFVRVVIVTSGATTGGVIAAAILIGDAQSLPVSHS